MVSKPVTTWCSLSRCCLTLLLFLETTASYANSITVACPENTRPFCYVADNKITGIVPEIYRELESRMQVQFVIKAVPMKRALLKLQDGQIAMAAPSLGTKKRALYSHFLETPIFSTKVILYGTKSSYFRYNSVDDLYGKVIGKRRGYYLAEQIAKGIESGKIKVVEANSDEQLLALLSKGRVDYVVTPEHVVAMNQWLVDSGQYTNYGEISGETLLIVLLSKYHAFSSELGRVNDVLSAMHADGTLERIVDKYPVRLPQ